MNKIILLLMLALLVGCSPEEEYTKLCVGKLIGYEEKQKAPIESLSLLPGQGLSIGHAYKNITISFYHIHRLIPCVENRCLPLKHDLSQEHCELIETKCEVKINKTQTRNNIRIRGARIQNRNDYTVHVSIHGQKPIYKDECKMVKKE